jgi:hypothetical protein
MASASIKSVLVLAPHLRFPFVNGADIYVGGLVDYLSHTATRLTLVTSQQLIHYSNGICLSTSSYQSSGRRSKGIAAFRTLLFGSHYLYESFITYNFKNVCSTLVDTNIYDAVICSYMTTAYSVLANLPPYFKLKKLYVLTHNDEFRWFKNISKTSDSILMRQVAETSFKWLKSSSSVVASKSTLVHISESDATEWNRHIPRHASLILSPGVILPSSIADPILPNNALRLLFAGSLSSQMNIDAVKYFAHFYLPEFVNAFRGNLSVHIAGSNPTQDIINICHHNDWVLRANLTDAEMDKEFLEATFSILPFEYSNGLKLKLLKSFSYGVPVLACSTVLNQDTILPPPNLVSDSPSEWVYHSLTVVAEGISLAYRQDIVNFVRPLTWASTCSTLVESICTKI